MSGTLPWRLTALDGFSTTHGYTYNGGTFTGGGPHHHQSVGVRMQSAYGEPASVSLELCDDRGGRAVSLKPELAREVAAALLAAAEAAEAEMQKWRDILDKQREEIRAMQHRDLIARAGLVEEQQ